MKSKKANLITKKPLTQSTNTFPVVGIGASAGGLDAFKKLLKAIPENSGMAFVLVQHLHPGRESMLPEILQKVTTIPTLEIVDDLTVEPNHIYIIPSNKIVIANDGKLELGPRSTNKEERVLPIDIFFSSLAEVHKSHAIGVVLSGTATDGTKGLKAIKDHGGITIAQEEASAQFDGMPHSAIQAGVVDFILLPEAIPKKLLDITSKTVVSDEEINNPSQQDEDVFRQILSLLRLRKGTDFTYYKQSTISRRILRRLALNKIEDLAGYLMFLRENKSEQDVLFQDLLIPVTSFFRDATIFEELCNSVFPQLLKNKSVEDPVRIWVAGCSTGQEAYSVAICLKEFLGNQLKRVQIFATDISEPAIAKARTGIYLKNEVDGLSSQRLQEFFSKHDGSYQVAKFIRDMCVFAVHNFIKDAPFGNINFLSCRNVLIYMEPYLQKRALTTFHYALNPNGFLLLGKSETINSVPELFGPEIKHDKIFSRKNVPGRFTQVANRHTEQNLQKTNALLKTGTSGEMETPVPNLRNLAGRTDFQKAADDIMLAKYTPAGVVVNEAMDIVHFRGKTGNYLEQSSGKPSHNLIKMAKEGLAFELRNILHKVKKEKVAVVKENIPMPENGGLRNITIEAVPLADTIEPHFLVLFTESVNNDQAFAGSKKSSAKKEDKDVRIALLEKELAEAREDMRSITEDQEAVNEELQSANEELLSGSEELQSLNEEMDTSREELQSTNEELTVLNQELIGMNEQITEARNYAENIIATIREPLLVLDKNLRVKSANNVFYKTFHVNEAETEGKSVYELGNRQWDIPALRTLLDKILPEKSKFEGFEVTYNFPKVGERVMMLNASEMHTKNGEEKSILLAIEDVTDTATARKKIEASEEKFRRLAELIPEKISTADAEGNITYYNQSWLSYSGYTIEETKDWGWNKMIHPAEVEELTKRWAHSIATGDPFEMELHLLNKQAEYRWHLCRSSPVKDEHGNTKSWITTTTEIQHQKEQSEELEKLVKDRTFELQKANEGLQKMNKELEAFTYVSSHDLQEPLRKIQTFAARLLDKEKTQLSDTGKDYLQRMSKAAIRMQTLIEDLLNYSQASIIGQKVEITDLNKIVGEVKEELAETLLEKRAIIEVGELCKVPINPSQFRQVIHNLINNALKFSKPGLPAHIIIRSETGPGSRFEAAKLVPEKVYCRISISDNGIGFAQEYKDKIFEVFQRLHGKEEYAGTGIGLAIVKKIVDNHNGHITATGSLNKGARFDIYLPINQTL